MKLWGKMKNLQIVEVWRPKILEKWITEFLFADYIGVPTYSPAVAKGLYKFKDFTALKLGISSNLSLPTYSLFKAWYTINIIADALRKILLRASNM